MLQHRAGWQICWSHGGESISKKTIPKEFRSRCKLNWVSAVVRGGFHLGSVYLVSSIGVKAKRNMDLLESIATTLKTLAGRWILGGGLQLHTGATCSDWVVANGWRSHYGTSGAHVFR